MELLPEELKRRAFQGGPNDYAWNRHDAVAVALAFGESGIGIVGGEVWLEGEDGSVWAGIPQAKGGPPGVYSWSTHPIWRPESETWEQYCQRAAEYTVWMITKGLSVDDDVPRALRQRIRYNLLFVRRSEY